MEENKTDAPKEHTTQQATPSTPVNMYVKPIEPQGTAPRFLNKKYASAIIFVVCIGIIAFAFTIH